ncbi:MAG: TlpA family protein disulfide reductase [Bacteroidia bacterium]|nr:TlpA family protein disulfide reductase [Bacteroidia bacterium]
MKKYFLLILCIYSHLVIAQINPGMWRGELVLHDSLSLPFNFEVKDNVATIINAEERIPATISVMKNDSILIRLPDFDAEIHASSFGDLLIGEFFNLSRKEKNVITFRASAKTGYRFSDRPERTSVNITGKWKAKFDGEDDENKYSVGLFNQEGNRVTGTFLTNTGDYRFLEGEISGKHLSLSAFDGAHSFLFFADVINNEITNGHFFSGLHWHDTWSAVRDSSFNLQDERTFSHLKDGYSKLEFSFPDVNGKMLSLADIEFKNKVVIVQIMGSWCPNCLDETRYLSDWFNTTKPEDVRIIGLDYEKNTDTTVAYRNIRRLIDRYHVNYPILFGGSSNREETGKTLPMLSRIFSFPTTIYVNKDGTVREIHSGFNGPATGQYFEDYKREFAKLIEEMRMK